MFVTTKIYIQPINRRMFTKLKSSLPTNFNLYTKKKKLQGVNIELNCISNIMKSHTSLILILKFSIENMF